MQRMNGQCTISVDGDAIFYNFGHVYIIKTDNKNVSNNGAILQQLSSDSRIPHNGYCITMPKLTNVNVAIVAPTLISSHIFLRI